MHYPVDPYRIGTNPRTDRRLQIQTILGVSRNLGIRLEGRGARNEIRQGTATVRSRTSSASSRHPSSDAWGSCGFSFRSGGSKFKGCSVQPKLNATYPQPWIPKSHRNIRKFLSETQKLRFSVSPP